MPMNRHDHHPISETEDSGRIDISRIRRRLEEMHGLNYWRSLDEIAGTPEFQDFLHREFPSAASELKDEVSRRHFLKIMGASLALTGMAACTRQPVEKIVPYVKQPPELVPGKPLHYATTALLDGFATGILVTTHEGRPTKIEGNPDHPINLGATTAFGQAMVLDLYDPDRAQTVLNAGKPASWEAFLSVMNLEMRAQREKKGAGLRILSGCVTSPVFHSQMRALLAAFPLAKWCQREPVGLDTVRLGAQIAFGRAVETLYNFEKADVILALDADFLSTHPASLRYARQFSTRRRPDTADGMNRLYVAEPSSSITGAMADHRLSLAAGGIEALASALAHRLGLPGDDGGAGEHGGWIAAVAADLKRAAGRSAVIAGKGQPASVHALVHWINGALGNAGKTVVYTNAFDSELVNGMESLKKLVADIESGSADMLVMLGGNPVYDAPVDIDFSKALEKLKMCVRLGVDENETSRFCHWHIPAAHELESWGDARAFDGTVSITQPLIEPLYGGKTPLELIDALLRQPTRNSYTIVRDYWSAQNLPDFEKTWRKALSDGFIAGTAFETIAVTSAEPARTSNIRPGGGLELVFRPDPSVWDGRFVNNAWLQELPRPFTKLTWDNAALISPALAQREQLQNGDVVELEFRGRTLRIPVWILPGQAENSVTLHLGYGRQKTGRVGTGTGFNAYALRTSDALWFGSGLQIRKTGETYPFSTTQRHFNVEGRDIIREGTWQEFQSDPHFMSARTEPEPGRDDTLYSPDEFKYTGYKWGMSIDLNTCIGCNTCAIACQAENNIPTVGKDQVARGREMHWIRVDAYYRGGLDDPEISHQPVPCMHCENAPCEVVCPVGATVHDDEGLNMQVYNRCIGTRYCSNNCPYKVRRFNFLEFNAGMTSVQKMVKNPDVTVRSRGVMEKCTYCTQRINAARITAEKEDRKIRDGELVTACQAACPAEAIVFGDLNDPASRVSKLRAQPLSYGMLGELNTRPRTSYLGKLRNPNPEMKS